MDVISALIEFLKGKKQLSQLETDILETIKECRQNPFERKSAETRMDLNYTNYKDIFAKAASVPGAVPRPSSALSDQEIVSNLQYQLSLLAEKEQEALRYGQQT